MVGGEGTASKCVGLFHCLGCMDSRCKMKRVCSTIRMATGRSFLDSLGWLPLLSSSVSVGDGGGRCHCGKAGMGPLVGA